MYRIGRYGLCLGPVLVSASIRLMASSPTYLFTCCPPAPLDRAKVVLPLGSCDSSNFANQLRASASASLSRCASKASYRLDRLMTCGMASRLPLNPSQGRERMSEDRGSIAQEFRAQYHIVWGKETDF